jgi:hypothetical protein
MQIDISLYARPRISAALMATTDSAMMASPVEATGACHHKYHQLAGM